MKLLKHLTNRRQLLLSGIALAILSPRGVMAKEQETTLRASSRHSQLVDAFCVRPDAVLA